MHNHIDNILYVFNDYKMGQGESGPGRIRNYLASESIIKIYESADPDPKP